MCRHEAGSGSIRGNHENEIIPANTSPAIPDAAAPESETRASKPDLRQSGGAERLAHGVGEEEETPTGPGEENADPASAVGENAGGLLSGENGGEQNCEGNRSDGKEEEVGKLASPDYFKWIVRDFRGFEIYVFCMS